jgi:hypothetical protein
MGSVLVYLLANEDSRVNVHLCLSFLFPSPFAAPHPMTRNLSSTWGCIILMHHTYDSFMLVVPHPVMRNPIPSAWGCIFLMHHIFCLFKFPVLYTPPYVLVDFVQTMQSPCGVHTDFLYPNTSEQSPYGLCADSTWTPHGLCSDIYIAIKYIFTKT